VCGKLVGDEGADLVAFNGLDRRAGRLAVIAPQMRDLSSRCIRMAASPLPSSALIFSTLTPSAGVTTVFTAFMPPSDEKEVQPPSKAALPSVQHSIAPNRNGRADHRYASIISNPPRNRRRAPQ